jgi:hypothetical protein
MENILKETALKIILELDRFGIRLGTWEQDAIHLILTPALTRCFNEGRSAGQKDVLSLLGFGGFDYIKKVDPGPII